MTHGHYRLLAVGGGGRGEGGRGGTCCLSLFIDLLFSLLRLLIAQMEMKTTGENHKGVGVWKRENRCTL